LQRLATPGNAWQRLAKACNAGLPAEVVVTYPTVIDIPGTGTHSFTLTGRAVMTCLER